MNSKLKTSDIALIEKYFAGNQIAQNPETIEKIGKYIDLINLWSQKMNLVSAADLKNILERHFLDSLTPLKEISPGDRLLDIGSGAGFPGIPLAIIIRNAQIDLIDSVHKKIVFLTEIKKILMLDNVKIIESRLENYKPPYRYDLATIRALPKWQQMINFAYPLLKDSGKLIYYDKLGTYRIL